MPKNKKILVLASTFPASDADPVPKFVKEQIIALKKEYPDMEISILAPHDARTKTSSYTKHSEFDEYRFHYMWPHGLEKLAGRGIMPQLKKNPLYYLLIPNLFLWELLATKRLIRKLHPDYIYAHWFTPQGVVAGMAAKNSKVPVVITTHASDVAVWHKVPFGGVIVRRYIKKAGAITAVSRRTLAKLRKFFDEQQWESISPKTRIIPMGVDLTTTPQRRQVASQNIVFLGRLAEKKGVHYLLPAFAKLVEEYPDATLTIGGDGPMLTELKTQAEQLGIAQKVQFVGWVDAEQKLNLLQKSDVYVVPSIVTKSGDAEGLPVTLMEGMATGNVCVATNETGADDIITDGKDGFLVSQKDIAALQKALQKALNLTPAERQRMQEQAARTADQFSWDKIAKAHYDFLFKD